MESGKKTVSETMRRTPVSIISIICLTIIYTKMLDVIFGLFLEGKFKNLTNIVLVKEIVWHINTNTVFHFLWVVAFIVSSLRVATSLLVFEIDSEIVVALRKKTSEEVDYESLSRLLLAILVYMQFSALCIGSTFLSFLFFTMISGLCWVWDKKTAPAKLKDISRLNTLLRLWRWTDPLITVSGLIIAGIIFGAKIFEKELPMLVGIMMALFCAAILVVALADFYIGRLFYKKLLM